MAELGALLDAGPFAPMRDAVLAGTKPAIVFDTSGCEDDAIEVGASKLGGLPDLPQDVSWPERNGRPLIFVGQFELSALPALRSGDAALPRSGILSLWYDLAEGPWGFDPADAGGFQAMHLSARVLVRRSMPAYAPGDLSRDADCDWEPLPSWRMTPRISLSIAGSCFNSEAVAWNQLGTHEHPAFASLEALEEIYRPANGHHQLLGFPYEIQGAMESECQLASNGVYCGGPLSPSDQPRANELAPGIEDWVLLCQVDTEVDDKRDAELVWGDGGALYYWIRRQDLARSDFSRVWGVLQAS